METCAARSTSAKAKTSTRPPSRASFARRLPSTVLARRSLRRARRSLRRRRWPAAEGDVAPSRRRSDLDAPVGDALAVILEGDVAAGLAAVPGDAAEDAGLQPREPVGAPELVLDDLHVIQT